MPALARRFAGPLRCLLTVLVALTAIILPKLGADEPARLGGEKNASGPKGGMALAVNRVAIKKAALKVAEARKKLAIAVLTSSRSRVVEARAAEDFSQKQFKRMEVLLKERAVDAARADERRAHWEAAKAGRTLAEGKVSECEAAVALEEARIALARLEVEEAELRLEQRKTKAGTKP